MSTALSRLSELAKAGKTTRFLSLAHLLTPAALMAAFEGLRKDASAGVDEVTYREYEQDVWRNIPTLLVGHVTKDGSLAGPKALEHVVDTVLYFEGERHHSHRVVRAVKNRFGAISELGVFEMTSTGLRAVPNPSTMFLAERPSNAPGATVPC